MKAEYVCPECGRIIMNEDVGESFKGFCDEFDGLEVTMMRFDKIKYDDSCMSRYECTESIAKPSDEIVFDDSGLFE